MTSLKAIFVQALAILYGGPQVSRQMFDVDTAKLKRIRRHLFFTCYLSFRQALLFCNGLKQDLASVATKLRTRDNVCQHHGKSLLTSRQKFVNIAAKVCEHRSKSLLTSRQKFVDITAKVCEHRGKSLSTSRQKFEHHGGSENLSISCQFSTKEYHYVTFRRAEKRWKTENKAKKSDCL